MPERPFHHGNLRAVLLERAETMLRGGGADAVSLRELARQAGVSHGAPRSHFVDRQALLDALAIRGFGRLTDELRIAIVGAGRFEERFRRTARAYIDFAVQDAALMDLMFAAKGHRPDGLVSDAAAELFQVMDAALGDGRAVDEEAGGRFKLLFAASVQGVATLIAAQRVTPAQGERLTEDVVAELLASPLLARARASVDGDVSTSGTDGEQVVQEP